MPVMTQREQKPSVSRGPSGTPMVGTRRGVQAHGRGSGQVQALGLAVDGNGDSVVGKRDEFGGKPPRLVAEQPRGRCPPPAPAVPFLQPLPSPALGCPPPQPGP